MPDSWRREGMESSCPPVRRASTHHGADHRPGADDRSRSPSVRCGCAGLHGRPVRTEHSGGPCSRRCDPEGDRARSSGSCAQAAARTAGKPLQLRRGRTVGKLGGNRDFVVRADENGSPTHSLFVLPGPEQADPGPVPSGRTPSSCGGPPPAAAPPQRRTGTGRNRSRRHPTRAERPAHPAQRHRPGPDRPSASQRSRLAQDLGPSRRGCRRCDVRGTDHRQGWEHRDHD